MVVLNGALAGVATAIKDLVLPPELSPYMEVILSVANVLFKTEMFKEEVFKEVSVAELAFDGYQTGLLNGLMNLDDLVLAALNLILQVEYPTLEEAFKAAEELLAFLGYDDLNLAEMYIPIKKQIEDLVASTPQISGGKFGIFKGKNATKTDSYYKINTGLYEKHNYLKMLEFNGKTRLPDAWWPDVAPTPTGQDAGVKGICHEIYGTDGSQFPPFLQKEVRIWIYVAEMCRSVYILFQVW